MFGLQSPALFTGFSGGTWKRIESSLRTASSSREGFGLNESTKAVYYLKSDNKLYAKAYSANGTGTLHTIADFTGILSNSAFVAEFDNHTGNRVFIVDGHIVYAYVAEGLP